VPPQRSGDRDPPEPQRQQAQTPREAPLRPQQQMQRLAVETVEVGIGRALLACRKRRRL